MKSYTARDIIRQLRGDGWVEDRARSTSHRQFYHPMKPGKVTVPVHPGDIPPATTRNIERQAGLRLK